MTKSTNVKANPLRKNLRIDSEKAVKGIRFELSEYPNEDGTIPTFILASTTRHNVGYQKALREAVKEHNLIEADGSVKNNSLTDEELEKIIEKITVENTVIGWENFEPEESGVKIPFSLDKAVEILLNPDWVDLLAKLNEVIRNTDNYRIAEREQAAKN